MSGVTGIEWTDATWNPIRGCSRVSEGCRNCYAEKVAHRFSRPGSPYDGVVRVDANGKSTGQWNGEIKFVEERLLDPLRWKKPRRIFVNSMSDLFHPGVTDEMLDRIFAVMALCPQHTFQVLTKRPERMREYLNDPNVQDRVADAGGAYEVEKAVPLEHYADRSHFRDSSGVSRSVFSRWPLKNVWLGVSVEEQSVAKERIWPLLKTSAALRFVSAEPLLGPLDLNEIEALCWTWRRGATIGVYLDWVICGGESGPDARPMHPDWARSLRDQCHSTGVPFFFKQNGEYASVSEVAGPGVHYHFPDEATVRRVGKKLAGDLLDGQRYHQFPEVRA